ncbi:MAG: Nucleolar Complex 2 protein [Caeruleum heppii]|nr:MAG: Nucleolar Complex 2 protein [Caeruleum heppii]
MAKNKKATRKFEKNHLKDTIERRKEFAKIKQRNQVKDKKKARRAKDYERVDSDEEAKPKKVSNGESKGKNAFEDMTVDDFFRGGFDIPERKATRGPKAGKTKVDTKKLGKRKRTTLDDKGDSSSEASAEGQPLPSDVDSGSDRDEDLDAHKEDLEALKAKDPEFYKFLQENDSELLAFDEHGDLAEVEELSGSDEEEARPSKKSKKQKKVKKDVDEAAAESNKADSDQEKAGEDDGEVTAAMVSKWRVAMTDVQSLRAMRQVVLAFRAAAYVNEQEGKEYKYTISSPEVYHELLMLALKHVPDVLKHHLPIKESAPGKLRVPTDSKKFRTLTPLLKSHSSSMNHLLTSLNDASTIKVTLASLLELLPYLLSFKKILRGLIKTVVAVWSDSSSTEATRINAFLVIRRMAVIGDSGIREAVLRSVYQGLVKGSRNTTVHTMQGVNLMKNSAAELWGLDPVVGYTTGFTFIRQLAIHLRGSITNPSKDSYKTIYNWQYTHSLDFWSRVLSTHCSSLAIAQAGHPKNQASSLQPLIYPVVQITLGALRLIPTAQYFPLRFHLIRSLLRISLATETYIPLGPALLEVLHSAEMRKAPKPSTLKPIDFSTTLRAPKAYLRTRVYQDGVGDQTADLLADFFLLWTRSIAFPELSLPVTVTLKRWLRDTGSRSTGNKNAKLASLFSLLVQKLEANARFIEQRRAKVDFAPDDRAAVEGFLRDESWEVTPLGAFVKGTRRAREERERILEMGRREEDKRGRAGREGRDEEDGEGRGEGGAFSEEEEEDDE